MKALTSTTKLLALAAAGGLLTLATTSPAQPIYTNTFNYDDSTNWAVNFSYTCPPPFDTISNSLVNFNFDYTTAGIPIAPHSALFGSDAIHHGLKMSACYTNPASLKGNAATAGLSASPTNFSITANFVLHADMWINVNCGAYPTQQLNNVLGASYATSPHNGSASTVLYGCGYGTAGTTATTPGVTDAIFVGSTADNGSSAQMRMYGPSTIGQSAYQDGVYQSTGTASQGFPGDPYVYNANNASGTITNGVRSWTGSTGSPPFNNIATNTATGQSWGNIFPPQVCPLAQQILYPQQTNNASCPGLLDFAWHDVSLEKVGNVIVYKIDGNIIATGNYSSAGTPAGSLLTFIASRTSGTVASAATSQYTNLNFVVFANVVVSNYNNIVNVAALQATTSEDTPGSPGVLQLTRGSAGVPLTVNYTLTGTAINGSQYSVGAGATATSVTFASTATTTNITIVPIDDGVPRATTTVILTLQNGAGYAGAGSAIVNILDADPTTVDISGSSQAYGRYTVAASAAGYNDFISYNLTRRGKLTIGSDLTVNLTYSGTAAGGTDYTPISTVTIPDGQASPTGGALHIAPLDNPSATDNRTVVVAVASGSGYAIGASPATGTVVPAHYPAAPGLLTNDLTSAADSVNWTITYGVSDLVNDPTDYEANFGMTLAPGAGGYTIGPPPGGNATALHLTCNKDNVIGAPGAVNAYYTKAWLAGDYAVRFNMNVIQGETTANSAEGPVFGINHTGIQSNWWYGTGTIPTTTWASDGIWYYISAQAAGSVQGDYQIFTGEGGTNGNLGWTRPLAAKVAATYAQMFKDNPGPFTCVDGFGNQTPGIPAEGSPQQGYDVSTWSDVEIKQVNNVITLSINHTPIYVYTNTTVWTSGYLMLGYADPFGATVGNAEAGVYYANLEVVSLQATLIKIDNIAISGGNVVIKFTTQNSADTTSSFTLQSSVAVDGTYTAVSPAATITSLGMNQFQATTPYLGGPHLFYRIKHN